MTTPVVRAAFMKELISVAPPALDIQDLSKYVSLDDLPSNTTDVTLLLQFMGGSDDMMDIGGEGNQGWSERGTVAMHYLIPAGFDYTPHLVNMEAIRKGLRGRRLDDGVVLESVAPFTDQISNAVRLNGGWHGWVSYVSYNKYDCG